MSAMTISLSKGRTAMFRSWLSSALALEGLPVMVSCTKQHPPYHSDSTLPHVQLHAGEAMSASAISMTSCCGNVLLPAQLGARIGELAR